MSTHTLTTTPLPGGQGVGMTWTRNGAQPTWEEVLRLLRTDVAFVDAFTDALAGAPYEAFLWETTPVARSTPFQWVVIPSLALVSATTDDGPFAEHIRGQRGIQVFENLSGDARLVVPCAPGEDPRPRSHAHLAAFVRGAPREQIHALWVAVAAAAEERLGASSAPFWVSTSGLGVYWVHVRIDERPKYYSHRPYRRAPNGPH